MIKKYNLCILVYFKNEQNCIYEWVTHYKMWGVDHIWMINNGSSDNSLQILKPFEEEGFITVWDEPNLGQEVAYTKYFSIIKRETVWLGVFDMDEFLYSERETNLKNVLRPFKNKYKIISIQSKIFYPGTFLSPPSIIEHSTLVKGSENSRHPKCIYNISHLRSISIHGTKERKKCKLSHKKYFTWDNKILCINHYRFPSYEYLYGIKYGRGGGVTKSKYKKISPYLNLNEKDVKKDDSLKKLSTTLIQQCHQNFIKPKTEIYNTIVWKQIKEKNKKFCHMKKLSIKNIHQIQENIVSLHYS